MVVSVRCVDAYLQDDSTESELIGQNDGFYRKKPEPTILHKSVVPDGSSVEDEVCTFLSDLQIDSLKYNFSDDQLILRKDTVSDTVYYQFKVHPSLEASDEALINMLISVLTKRPIVCTSIGDKYNLSKLLIPMKHLTTLLSNHNDNLSKYYEASSVPVCFNSTDEALYILVRTYLLSSSLTFRPIEATLHYTYTTHPNLTLFHDPSIHPSITGHLLRRNDPYIVPAR